MGDMALKNTEESCLEKLKEEYGKFRGKYKLPEFRELNRVFDIEESDFESDFLLRKIRKVISERVAGYLRFIEVILNPSIAPMFFFKIIKKLDSEDRKVLGEIYERLGKTEVDAVGLDLEYKEEKEAQFISELFETFDDNVGKQLKEIVGKLGGGKGVSKKESNGSYFG